MIEKMMKAVKRGNKKRSRNITIGAVVGFLLSCTAVMGADEYLWIKNDSGTIKFSTDMNPPAGTVNPYSENNWDGSIYINNIILSGRDNNAGAGAYGLQLEGDLRGFEFINNSSITGTLTGRSGGSYGIYNDSDSIRSLTNNGSIIGTNTGMNGGGSGIYSNSGTIESLINNGLISGTTAGNGERGSGIFNYSGTITTLTNNGIIIGTSSDGKSYGIYSGSNAAIGVLTNIGLTTGTATGSNGEGYGIYSGSNATIGVLTNIGLTTGTAAGSSGKGYGIYTSSDSTITSLVNRGLITGTSAGSNGEGYGIYSNRGTIEDLVNSGSITGISSGDTGEGVGIYAKSSSTIRVLTNIGLITGTSAESSGKGYGIYSRQGGITSLINSGLITGIAVENSNESYGVHNDSGTIDALTNTGVIYGKTNAVGNTGTITSFNNYGLLISETGDTVNGATLTNEGLIFKKVSEGKYTAKDDADYKKFGTTAIADEYTIINAKALGKDKDNITGTESLSLDKGVLTYGNSEKINISSDEKYILNGITDTLKVTGRGNELNNSTINAYETAVAMNGMSMLTLNNTEVNGGVKDSTVNIAGNGNTFTVQGDSVINSSDTAIKVDGNNNDVTLEGNTVVNGKMESTGNNNIINLHGKNMSILHDISGFENMNIKNNVTFFEDVNIKGLKEIKVEETGVLNLRLKADGTINVKGEGEIAKADHAFIGNDMIIQGEGNGVDTAGTLNFVTNGIGKKIYVDMTDIELKNLYIKTSSPIDGYKITDRENIILGAYGSLNEIYRPENTRTNKRYESLNNIYKGIYSSTDENLNALRALISFNNFGNNYEENMSDDEQLKNLMSYLNSIYAETPYSFSSELSRKSTGMFRDIVTENHFRPDLNKWMIMGGLTHADGGTKDTYYGQNYHGFDGGTADTDVDMKLTGAYALGKYGYSENVSLGVTVGGNKSEAELSMSKVEGSSGYIGAFAENYRGNLTLKAGGGIQYSEYDADRRTLGGHSYNEKYSDMAYDIYLNGRYSHNIGDNLFLEPYGTLSYTYIDQDGADEGNQTLAIETDSKSFDYTVGKIGVDLKKVIPHEKGKSTLSAGVSYTKILDGADEEFITGRFKGGSDFDILVAHKNEHSIGLNAKYALELENGVLFDVKGTYAVERDSHNGAGKNKTKGEWIVGAGLGYKF